MIDGSGYGVHIDLARRIDSEKAKSFIPEYPGSCEAQWDCDTGTFWHGTHVAGIIAADLNGVGTVGIAHEATIVPFKSLHGGSGSWELLLSAIIYAATDAKAGIINMSLRRIFPRYGAGELVVALNIALNFAGSRGVLVISAAGNDQKDLEHSGNFIVAPAESGNGLAVSATGLLGFGYNAGNFTRFAS